MARAADAPPASHRNGGRMTQPAQNARLPRPATAPRVAPRTAHGKRGARYRGMPGAGPTAVPSVLCVATLAALWWAATHFHWLPPLFLPSPEAVWRAFIDAVHGRLQGGLPLSEHLLWSAMRVFGAFALAVVTAVPVGI